MLFNCTATSCGQCTGALINRGPQDFAPIFMTARHCIQDQTAANSLIVFCAYQDNACNGTSGNLGNYPRNARPLLLKTDGTSDWTLLGLYQVPRANFYIGWDANYLGNGSAVFGLHHAGGNPTLYCAGTKVGDTGCGAVSASNEWDVAYGSGRTFP